MLQNARVTASTVSELLWENQHGGKTTPPPRPRLGLKSKYVLDFEFSFSLFHDIYCCIY